MQIKIIIVVHDIMLVPKVPLYYPQIWRHHPCMDSLLPADNEINLHKIDKTKIKPYLYQNHVIGRLF